jgi:hypothetical protein
MRALGRYPFARHATDRTGTVAAKSDYFGSGTAWLYEDDPYCPTVVACMARYAPNRSCACAKSTSLTMS